MPAAVEEKLKKNVVNKIRSQLQAKIKSDTQFVFGTMTVIPSRHLDDIYHCVDGQQCCFGSSGLF